MGPKVTETDVLVGKRLRQRRKELQLSQKTVAERMGVAFQQVQKYEAGTNRIGAGRLDGLSTFLGVPVSYFFVDDNGAAAQKTRNSFAELATPGAIELLKAFAAISDPEGRKAVINLARRFSREQDAAE